MTDSRLEAPARTCGACGAPVAAAAVSCPTCGAFLAAYESAGTSATQDPKPTDTSATRDPAPTDTSATQQSMPPVPSPSSSSAPAPTPAVHRPTSRSPIGDALRRSRADSAWYQAPAETTLAEMAAGNDDLADMADGDDDLAEMAAGDDELSQMAGGDSTLAREVEAELAGAKVTFDGGAPKIEAAPAPEPVASPASAAPRNARPARTQERPVPEQRARRGVYEDPPIAWVDTDKSGRVTNRAEVAPARLVAGLPSKVIGIGAVLVVCVVMSVLARTVGGFSVVFPLVVVGIVVWGLLKGAGATGRKTTTMPRDKRQR